MLLENQNTPIDIIIGDEGMSANNTQESYKRETRRTIEDSLRKKEEYSMYRHRRPIPN